MNRNHQRPDGRAPKDHVVTVAMLALALVLAACGAADTQDTAVDDAAGAADDDGTEAAPDTEVTPEDDAATDDAGSGALASDLEEVEAQLAAAGFGLCPQDGGDAEHEGAVTTIPDLDLASLQAEALDRTFEAQAYANTYVGEVTDDLFVAVSLDAPQVDDATEVTVYLCDSGEVSTYLTGAIEAGTASLSDEQVDVELRLGEEEAIGTVTLTGQEPIEISAARATSDAGLYRAVETEGDVEVLMRWIVLEDGRQRGDFICCPRPQPGSTQCWCCIYLP